jgi:hypothetical protein
METEKIEKARAVRLSREKRKARTYVTTAVLAGWVEI